MAVKLRKKAPFWCRHKDASGKLDHLSYALAEADADMCQPHAAEVAVSIPPPEAATVLSLPAKTHQFNLPESRPSWPFWPINDDGSPCSPRAQEAA